MLMSISYDIIESLVVRLVFDDDTAKKVKVNVDDIVRVTFNKNGCRTVIDGICKRLYHDNNHNTRCIVQKPNWIMIVDGSQYGASAIERIEVSKILNIDVLKRAEENLSITSPLGENNITSFRLVGNILQLSVDNGETWMKVLSLSSNDVEVPEEDKELASKVDALLPSTLRPDLREDLASDILELVKAELAIGDKEDPMTPEVTPTTN